MWTPDGKRLAFASSRAGAFNLYWQTADGTGSVERLTTSPNNQFPSAWTNDGHTLLYFEQDLKTSYDIHAVSVTGDRNHRPLIVTRFDERRPALSPDGRWLAYQSNELGTPQIHVRPYPDVDRARFQVSAAEGSSPFWAPDGQAIFYQQGGKIYRASVTATAAFEVGKAEPVVDGVSTQADAIPWTLTPDGKRLLIVKPVTESARAAEFQVIVNWIEEIKSRVGVTR